ncbi:MAG TPA: GNAT family N-acetyltransferase [Candidatus Dormibacteraeota bacterium]
MSEIKNLEEADEAAVLAFFERIPAADRNFFKEDLRDAGAVRAWLRDPRLRRAVAVEEDGSVAGYAALIPGLGWSGHVGELRLVVDPRRRRQGVGRRLAQWAVLEAIRQGLEKLTVEVVAQQEAAVAMFQQLGFAGEALLTDQVRDRDGELRDLLVLAHRVDRNRSLLETLGAAEE